MIRRLATLSLAAVAAASSLPSVLAGRPVGEVPKAAIVRVVPAGEIGIGTPADKPMQVADWRVTGGPA